MWVSESEHLIEHLERARSRETVQVTDGALTKEVVRPTAIGLPTIGLRKARPSLKAVFSRIGVARFGERMIWRPGEPDHFHRYRDAVAAVVGESAAVPVRPPRR